MTVMLFTTALLVSAPAATACDYQEYMSPEDLGSGTYKSSPPPWEVPPGSGSVSADSAGTVGESASGAAGGQQGDGAAARSTSAEAESPANGSTAVAPTAESAPSALAIALALGTLSFIGVIAALVLRRRRGPREGEADPQQDVEAELQELLAEARAGDKLRRERR